MGLYEARGQLDRALKDLMLRWAETKAVWRDQVGEDFEEKYLIPLERALRNAGTAMDTAAQLVSRARQECR